MLQCVKDNSCIKYNQDYMKKNRFFGKYYKFISDDGYTFALIVSHANEGDMLQLVTPTKGYFVKNTKSVDINNNVININIHEDDISLEGTITLGELHPLSKKVMEPFSILPMECKHEIYSMYHRVNGELTLNKNKKITFTNSLGYIEGDSDHSFPTKYIWYNSVTEECTVTLAIATIPLLRFINFTGLLCFIKGKGYEYHFCTYNGGKILSKKEDKIIIKKGKFLFELDISSLGGHNLKAPTKGNMIRYIKENINVPTKYRLKYKDKILIELEDPLSSLEYMY